MALLLVAAVGGGCGLVTELESSAAPEASPLSVASTSSAAPPGSSEPARSPSSSPAASQEADREADHEAAQPVAVRIPAIEAVAALQPLGLLDSGELAPPDYGQAGWWEPGPEPGEAGAAVIAGHLDSADGPDVFWRLADLGAGDAVIVERLDGTVVTFQVTSVEQHPQASFPTDRVYGSVAEPALRLITCGGDYDRSAGRYLDNIVVFAEPVAAG